MSENPQAIVRPGQSPRDIVSSKGSRGTNFLDGLRIIQGGSEAAKDPEGKGRPGMWTVGTDGEVLPKEFKIIIGPWRYRAIRFNKNVVELESYNLYEGVKYDVPSNDWILPNGFSPAYQEILDEKVKNNEDIKNLAGFDFLYYLPEFDRYATFFLAATAKVIPDPKIQDTCWAHRGRAAYLRSDLHPGKKFSWFIPQIRLDAQELASPHQWPDDLVNKFFNPGVTDSLTSSPAASGRTR